MGAEPAGARVVRAERAGPLALSVPRERLSFSAGACFSVHGIILSSEAALLKSLHSLGALQALLTIISKSNCFVYVCYG